MNKREFVKSGLIGLTGIILAPKLMGASSSNKELIFTTPNLARKFDDLNMFIDSSLLNNHYTTFYLASITKLNSAVKSSSLKRASALDIFRNTKNFDSNIINLAGEYFNHRVFWKSLSANGITEPSGDLGLAINKSFGSFNEFKDQLKHHSSKVNNGWAWLIQNSKGLKIVTTSKNANPLMSSQPKRNQGFPIMAIDLWKHSYSDTYHNTDEYISGFLNVTDWSYISTRYNKAKNYNI